MCHIIFDSIIKNNDEGEGVLEYLRKILRDNKYYPKDAKEICGNLLFTCYMGTENNAQITKDRAALLSKEIGSKHYNISISNAFKANV